jgi:hypothetical protein
MLLTDKGEELRTGGESEGGVEYDVEGSGCGIPEDAQDILRALALALEAAEEQAAAVAATGDSNAMRRANAAVSEAMEALDRALPPSVRQSFLRAAASGDALKDVGDVAPWWRDRLVGDDGTEPDSPAPHATDAFFSSPEGAARASILAPNACNILFAYAHVALLYGWRALDEPESAVCVEAAQALLDISGVLSSDVRHENVPSACASALEACRLPKLCRDAGGMPVAALGVCLARDDVAGGILSRRAGASRAFGHAARVFSTAAATAAARLGGRKACAAFTAAARKSEFFAAWARSPSAQDALRTLREKILVFSDEAAAAIVGESRRGGQEAVRPPRMVATRHHGLPAPSALLAGGLLHSARARAHRTAL